MHKSKFILQAKEGLGYLPVFVLSVACMIRELQCIGSFYRSKFSSDDAFCSLAERQRHLTRQHSNTKSQRSRGSLRFWNATSCFQSGQPFIGGG